MARDRRIPSVLARVSRRDGTPVAAIGVVIAARLAFVCFDQFWTGLFALPKTPHDFAIFAWSSTFGGFGLVFVSLLMSVGTLRSVRVDPAPSASRSRRSSASSSPRGHLGLLLQGRVADDPGPERALAWFAIGIVVALAAKGRTSAAESLGERHEAEAAPEEVHAGARS